MDFLFPLVALMSEATAKTVDKLNFSKNHVSSPHLMRLIFGGMGLSMFVYIVLTRQPLPDFSLVGLCLMGLITVASFGGNVFDYLSLKRDDLSLREPLFGFEPILAGLVGYLLFPGERKAIYIPALLLSIVAVYYGSHRRRLGKAQKKGMTYLLLAVIIYATLPSLYKLTLPYISPEYIAFIRVLGVLLLIYLFMPIHKHVKRSARTSKQRLYGLFAGVFYALGTVASLYAIDRLGVVQTMLLVLLAPALVYATSFFILKEKVRTGEMVSSLALAIIVLVATIA